MHPVPNTRINQNPRLAVTSSLSCSPLVKRKCCSTSGRNHQSKRGNDTGQEQFHGKPTLREDAKPRNTEIARKCQECRQKKYEEVRIKYRRYLSYPFIVQENTDNNVCYCNKHKCADVNHLRRPLHFTWFHLHDMQQRHRHQSERLKWFVLKNLANIFRPHVLVHPYGVERNVHANSILPQRRPPCPGGVMGNSVANRLTVALNHTYTGKVSSSWPVRTFLWNPYRNFIRST